MQEKVSNPDLAGPLKSQILLIANNKERGILLIFIHVTTNCIGKTPDSMVAS